MKTIHILIIISLFLITLKAELKHTQLINIKQPDNTELDIYKTVYNEKTYFHDCDGYIVSFDETDMTWYYNIIAYDFENEGKITTKKYLSDLKYGINVSERRNLIKKRNSLNNILPERTKIYYRVDQFNTTPSLSYDDGNPISLIEIYNEPTLIPVSLKKAKRYVYKNYPPLAKRCGVSGRVYLNFIINKEGTPVNIEIKKEKPKDMGFGKIAVKALELYRFSPAKQKDIPVSVKADARIEFKTKSR